MDTADRWLLRYGVQQIVLQAIGGPAHRRDVAPTGNIPPYILGGHSSRR
jgi:hypothetical protein